MDEQRTEGAAEPPPGGSAPPTWEDFVRENGGRTGAGARGVPDLSPLIAIVEALRRAIPHELQEQFNALQRELLLLIRGLIDWQLERLDAGAAETQVEDIPIE
jgi:hypothetical protein